MIKSLISRLSENDIQALRTIYALRCMSETLLHQYVYKFTNDEDTLAQIRLLIDLKLIEPIEWKPDEVIFCLTVQGVNVVRELSPVPLYKVHPRTGKKIYEVQAKELRPAQNLINHQLHLNELSLKIQERCGIPLSAYKDSKFASNFTYAQPDGVFELGDFDVFLEMDMGNEQSPELIRKWDHYRNYFSSQDYYLRRNRPIIVLFATENVNRVEKRRKTIVKTLAKSVFDLLGSTFNCYIGSSEYCADIFSSVYKKELLPVHGLFEGHGYTCPEYNSAKSTQYLERVGSVGLYVCSYEQRPINALKQAIYYDKNRVLLGNGRKNTPLIMVCNNENEMLNDLVACNELYTPGVYFTTRYRLGVFPLEKALFQFDKMGNRYHFSDTGWSIPVYE